MMDLICVLLMALLMVQTMENLRVHCYMKKLKRMLKLYFFYLGIEAVSIKVLKVPKLKFMWGFLEVEVDGL